MDIANLVGASVSVVGAARSGVAVAKLLSSRGARVFVSDQQRADQLTPHIAELKASRIEYEAGTHSDRIFGCTLMVVSPGVPSSAPVIVEAQKRNIAVVSELEVGSWFCRAPMVAITGSNGKTTTTTLLGRILGDAKKKHVVAGNIGTAFTSVALGLAETDVAVLEVSSFQLDHIESFRPRISVLLNITSDHMDRYDHSMERYAASKARVFSNQLPTDVLVYDTDDDWTARTIPSARCRKVGFSVLRKLPDGAFVDRETLVTLLDGARTEVIRTEEISIKGTHNLYNAMAATLSAQLLGVGSASIRATLRNFKGVEHRLEFVRELNGVRYYNDSKATNVDSVWYALQAFHEPIVLLLGGRDKGNDYARLRDLVRQRVKAVIAIGESAEKVARSFQNVTSIATASSMENAVAAASSRAVKGDVVLLSPACASFDWFKNYEERGTVFKALVNGL